MTIRVLIIDDSPTMRALLRKHLSSEADIEVVGTAGDAMEGRRAIKQLDPDVVTLDIEMPGMDGLAFLEKIMTLRPTPVIIVSGLTSHNCQLSARALAIGAVACLAKGAGKNSGGTGFDGLVDLVREAAAVQFHHGVSTARRPAKSNPVTNSAIHLVSIGASTGGVEALHTVLAKFPVNCPPTVIVQHVAPHFVESIAKLLDDAIPPKVRIAHSGDVLERGNVFLAPGLDRHLTVIKMQNGELQARIKRGPCHAGHRPSVNALFSSVAPLCNERHVGILLSGMGDDGAVGLLEMHKAGAFTIAQDANSSVVFGMPRAAIRLNAASCVCDVNQIAESALGNTA